MKRIEIEGYLILADIETTATVHEMIALPGPEECGCWYCENWVAGRKSLVPERVAALLATLAVPIAGETEVWEVPGDSAAHIYGGWYAFVGRIANQPSADSREFTMDSWRLSFSSGESYPAAFKGHDVVELHFLCDVRDFIERPRGGVGDT